MDLQGYDPKARQNQRRQGYQGLREEVQLLLRNVTLYPEKISKRMRDVMIFFCSEEVIFLVAHFVVVLYLSCCYWAGLGTRIIIFLFAFMYSVPYICTHGPPRMY